ncbi:CHAT domain-containing protein [Actinosynnema sp. NPDC023587]|uniref:CHAT domain-containing protein n=1 Tax=Actinosynnema sp. NPDC023587 TaxID=3154695 RepID=UPI0033F5533B
MARIVPLGWNQSWPRVHWCPVGIATFLPLHAAGRGCEAVMDRVVSCYTSTARALLHTRTPRTTGTPGSTLIVAVPDAPGLPILSGVDVEAAALRRLVPTATTVPPPGLRTSRDGVLTALPHHEIAHFACHGITDWTDPATSRLVLHDHVSRPLTVNDVSALHLPDARLAYLSACSTSGTSLRYTDEATHLTSAFQLAGYRNVIGTLWPINDRIAFAITRQVYEHLTDNGASPPRAERSAVALHHAVRRHRNKYPQHPTLWSSHVHTGHGYRS